MSRSVWLIPLASLSDPHIYDIYTSTEVHQIQYICPYYISHTSPLCHVNVILADSLRQSVWSHIYVIYTSTEFNLIKYICPYYITDTSSVCHVKVSLADSPGQSVWFPHLCHIYIHRSQSNTIYMSLLYHWHIFSMSCQGQSGWFPWSVCLIPKCMSHIHPQKSTLYNIYVPTISLTHSLYVMSRSVWMITMVSVVNTHIFIEIHKSRQNLYNKLVIKVQMVFPLVLCDTYGADIVLGRTLVHTDKYEMTPSPTHC